MTEDLDSMRSDLRRNITYGPALVAICTIPAITVIVLTLVHIRDSETQEFFKKLIQIPINLLAMFPFVRDAAEYPTLIGKLCIQPWYYVFNSFLWVFLEIIGIWMIRRAWNLFWSIRKLESEAIAEANKRQIRRERGFEE